MFMRIVENSQVTQRLALAKSSLKSTLRLRETLIKKLTRPGPSKDANNMPTMAATMRMMAMVVSWLSLLMLAMPAGIPVSKAKITSARIDWPYLPRRDFWLFPLIRIFSLK